MGSNFQCCTNNTNLVNNTEIDLETIINPNDDWQSKTLLDNYENIYDDFMTNYTSNNRGVFIRESEELSTLEGIVKLCSDCIKNLHVMFYKKENNKNNFDNDNQKNIFEKEILINPFGIVKKKFDEEINNSNKNDGTTIFGVCNNDILSEQKKSLFLDNELDYYFDSNTIEIEKLGGSYLKDSNVALFSIRFDIDTLKYYIRDLCSGIPTFLKITTETVLKANTFLSIGNSYLSISFCDHRNTTNISINTIDVNTSPNKNGYINSIAGNESNNVNIKVFNKQGHLIHEPINFQPSKSSIKIGRSKSNEVVLNDTSVSLFHCSIQFDTVVGWTIRDGSYSRKLINNNFIFDNYTVSKNGTWLYLSEPVLISNEMIFKIGNLLFKSDYC